jgi:DHA2 family multidrug resistance protein-like MFS transporter
MSAVPPRRAGAGSAMNDVSRELGAALGVAVMGSIAASRYALSIDSLTRGLPPAAQDAARGSLAGALRTASGLSGDVGHTLMTSAQTAFVDGVHLAVTIGAVLAAIAATIVLRYLPSKVTHGHAEHDTYPVADSVEDVLELGIAGIPPIVADEEFPDDSSELVPSST